MTEPLNPGPIEFREPTTEEQLERELEQLRELILSLGTLTLDKVSQLTVVGITGAMFHIHITDGIRRIYKGQPLRGIVTAIYAEES